MRTPPIALAPALLLAGLAAPAARADGVVTVVPQGNDLTIRGDAGDNSITVLPGDLASQIRIIPSDGTTLNGFALPADFDTPARTLDIRLDGGDDTIVFANGVDAGDLVVVLGSGSNTLTAVGARFDDITVEGSDDADRITLDDSAVEGSLVLDTLGGDDEVTIAGTSAVGGKTRMLLGAGDDVVGIDGTNFGKKVLLDLGPGSDGVTATSPVFQKPLSLRCGDGGTDGVLLADAVGLKTVKVRGASDRLTLTVTDSDLAKGMVVRCGDAADDVTVTGTAAGRTLVVKTRGGADAFTVNGNDFAKRIKLLGGDGDDTFEVAGNELDKGALVHGNDGTDTRLNDIEGDNTVNGGSLKVKSVEATD